MRQLLVILFCITYFNGFAQLAKSTSLQVTGNFDFTIKGLATNNAGLGAGIDVIVFGKHRLQGLIEANTDYFIGDKLLIVDSVWYRKAKSASVYSIKAGPQVFISKHIALSITYGVAWYTIRDFAYSRNDALKYSVTGFFGSQKHFVTKVFYVNIPTEEQPIRYIGFAAGYRF